MTTEDTMISQFNNQTSCSFATDNHSISSHVVSVESIPSFKNDPRIRSNGLLAKIGVPCQQSVSYNYGECFGYYENGQYNVCQFVEVGDIEDFMNNEKRKEKSRNAARCRRSRETELYSDLARALPFSDQHISQLDKASIMRLAISYLKVRNMVASVPEMTVEKEKHPTDESVLLKTLEGFVMILSEDGDFIYLSENVHEYLGINQIDLMGHNVYEFTHPCDHEEIRDLFSGKETDEDISYKSIFVRMKCTLTTKGRSVTLKSAVYKVIHSTGHIIKCKNTGEKENSEDSDGRAYFLAVSRPIPHPSNIETPLPKQTFLTKHNMDMKFTHADDELMKEVLGYQSDDLLGKSVFEYYHAVDSDSLLSSYKCLYSKGQCQTEQYRFLAKSGGYVWLVTQATLILDKNQKPQSVVCVNYVISGLECKDEIYSSSQFSNVKLENKSKEEDDNTVPTTADVTSNNNSTSEENNNEVKQPMKVRRPISSTRKLFGNLNEIEGTTRPRSATSKIFVPRTKDMNKGFLMFSDEEPGLTMLKDEPEDLTHLAPVAGDVCVPLDDPPFLPEMLDDILLKDNFGPLLAEEPSDPFISYRDFRDSSPQLLSPNLSKQSDCSLPSLNSPSDSLIDDDQTSTFMNLHMDEDVEMIKSPYTSMSISHEIPLLIPKDLMWSPNERRSPQIDTNSSLAQLLSASTKKYQFKNNYQDDGLIDRDVDDASKVRNLRKSWAGRNGGIKPTDLNRMEVTSAAKRSNCNIYDYASKKTRNEPKENVSSELLQQLISNSHNRGRAREKRGWLLKENAQKAACVSQPSESVLMNLLVDTTNNNANQTPMDLKYLIPSENKTVQQNSERNRSNDLLKKSINLLDPKATAIASLMDLTQQDYEVNAPAGNHLLQGVELLTALDTTSSIKYFENSLVRR